MEIDETIRRLNRLKKTLQQKKETLIRCSGITHGKIEIAELPEQYLLLTPLDISYDTHDSLVNDVGGILEHLRAALDAAGSRKNCGSYLSLEKIRQESFHQYDGIFTQMDGKKKNLYVRPGGDYLRGFCVGDWDRIPEVYKRMLNFAEERGLELTGYAYECGLNEFAIDREEDYITQIEIRLYQI